VAFQLVLRDRTPGAGETELTLDGLPQRITLRDLIHTRVREEVAQRNADALVRPRAGRNAGTIDWREQAHVAERAFEANQFFVLVGGKQVDDLAAELDLGVDTDVVFVRLVPLVGG
jgi:hypothetical protein